MTNYTRIATCAATGERAAAALPMFDGRVQIEAFNFAAAVGPNSTWAQRLACEWGYLGHIAMRDGDEPTASYCRGRVAQLIASEFEVHP